MPRYIHPHSLVPWERLYHASVYQTLIIFSSLTIFGEGVIISWHHIFIPDDIGEVVIISWHYIFTPDNIWWGGDYIVTLYFHSWQHLVRGDYIVTLYFHSWKYLVRGWLYHVTSNHYKWDWPKSQFSMPDDSATIVWLRNIKVGNVYLFNFLQNTLKKISF